jgi:diguanylate cyclase (GGDEF)-like protein/PAS domain S-box-containing protein
MRRTTTSIDAATARAATGRLWWLYIAGGLTVMAAYFAVPGHNSVPDQTAKVILYCLVSGSAAMAIAVGLYRHRPAQPLPWVLLLANQVVYFAADVSFYVRHDLLHLQAFPSISDFLYLTHYPLLVAGLCVFIRRRTPGGDRAALLDGVILATGATLIGWVFLLGPEVHGGSGAALTRLIVLGYPVMDLGVLAVAVRLVMGAGVRGRSFFLLVGALTLLLAADVVYGLQQIAGIYTAGNFVDVMWLGYYLLLGAAALHPSMSRLAEPSPVNALTAGRGRLISLGAAALMAPLAMMLQQVRTDTPDVVLLASGAAVMFLLVMVRMAGLVRSQRQAAGLQGLAESRARFEVMIENGSDLVVLTDRDLVVSYTSPTLTHLLGHQPDAWLGRRLDQLVIPADREIPPTMAARAGQDRAAPPADVHLLDGEGLQRTLAISCRDLTDNPAVTGLVWNGSDVTDRRELEDELTRQAFTDALTGLANRALFTDRLAQALARCARHGTTVGVLFVDLDRFKTVNDGLGHAAGDTFLIEVAGRLSGSVRTGDTVARHGGDEFTVLLEDLDGPGLAEDAADRILTVLRQPITINGTEVRLSASIGVALSDHALDEPEELMRAADLAMYQAKNTGRGRRARYQPDMRARAGDELALNADLDHALERGELEVYYQPTISLATRTIDGAEALLRWHHPTKGMISPVTFIPLAERSGQIVPIGGWVLAQACAQMVTWNGTAHPNQPLTIAVNLSMRQLADPDLVNDVARILTDSGLNPPLLILEITESVLMDDIEEVLPRLHALKRLGVRLAIDDFGTGYSSLAYLRRFPVDIVKIDKSFIDAAVAGAPGGIALIRAIVDLSSSLHLSTIAEGVENPSILPELIKIGCHSVQGFHFARPMPAIDLTAFMQRKTLLANAPDHQLEYVGASGRMCLAVGTAVTDRTPSR